MTVQGLPAPAPPEGLAGAPGELCLLAETVGARQRRACAGAGLAAPEPARDEGPRLVLREDAVVSAELLRDAAAQARGATEDLRFAVGGRLGELAADLAFGDTLPLLAWLPGGPATPERLRAAREVVLDPQERTVPVPLPAAGGEGRVQMPLSDRPLLPSGHWLQLLWANLLGLGPFLWHGVLGSSPPLAALRLLGAALAAGSLDPPVLATRLRRVGRGCRIHRAAVVEGSWLGDGVEVGPGAVVRGAVLGDGATVEEQALVDYAVLGPGARVQRQGLVKLSLVGPRAAVGGLVQLGVVDRDAQVKIGVHLMDMALAQGVQVQVAGRRWPAPLGLAGVNVGAGTLVGAGIRVAPGRALPAGLQILPPPDQVLRQVPPGLSGQVTVRDGRLVPLDAGAPRRDEVGDELG